ncbi:branched-chain amino acid ABC transporter ATP-binding protein/permease [Prosthecodimorpha staleyi]|uniref:ATP-binding cassette domain-containing protein n=1 Tax=Prosthecodimorpha staleyi TaxID=2840188 RepID=A0A947DA99_9HYPH|nr:ATP-binding cassette domain-containing protein [Prosthecodimorpha staleyi]
MAALAIAAFAGASQVLDTYSMNVLVRSLLYAVVALTVDILWGYLGILTFGQSTFFGIGAYAAGLVFMHLGFSPGTAALALVAGIVIAVVVAAVVAWLAFWHGASELYASVITLVLPIVATQVIFSGGTWTGSSSGLSGFETFDLSIEAWFVLAGSLLAVATAAAWVVMASDAGRLIVAIRENEQRCKYLGIGTARLKSLAFLVSAAIAAIAGYVFAGYAAVVAPELVGFVFGTELVIWVALGGRGTLLGPVIGTVLVDYESAQLSGDYPFVWKLIIGLVFVAVIVALPRGFLPILGDGLKRLGRLAGLGRTTTARTATIVAAARRTAAAAADDSPAIRIRGVAKHFGSLPVLRGIDFEARAGELVSLVGPNGAGKTTLMRCIADGSERSGGTIEIGGVSIGRLPPERCVALGIGRKFQMANVFDSLTVAECLQIARTRIDRPSLVRRSTELALPGPAARVVATTGLDQRLATPARLLSHGQKQALELAMVLALEPKVLLLDEPTAGLSKAERMLIGGILTDLATQERLCILLVEHDLDFVREISSRVVVLHQGRLVLDGTVEEVVGSETVKQIYAGAGHHGAPAEAAR